MRFSVRHQTLYRYTMPVRLGPHMLRLNPRADGARVLAGGLTVMPTPATRHDATDRFGNRITHANFEGFSDILRIDSRHVVDVPVPAPLGNPWLPGLPWSGCLDGVLPDYLTDDKPETAVAAFAATLAADSGWAVLPFLDRLNRTLFTRHDRRIRPEGAAQAPARTLAVGHGACRDLTVLFMAACRSLGIAARFVSGYQAHAATPDGKRHLHAWPEVFLPGLGWRGFDPTHGDAVVDGHLALCAAPDQAATMPVEGSFFGNGVGATLDYRVEIAAS